MYYNGGSVLSRRLLSSLPGNHRFSAYLDKWSRSDNATRGDSLST